MPCGVPSLLCGPIAGSTVVSQANELRMNEVPPLNTELTSGRLRLRVCRNEDADAVFDAEAESYDRLCPWFWWCHPRHSREQCRSWARGRADAWRADEEYSFLILDSETGRVFGCAWLNAIDRTAMRASLGYWVRSSSTGKGIATEAARLVARWGFDALKLQRIELVLAVGNKESERVAHKLGAIREGVARRRLRVNDKNQDAFVYSILPGEVTANGLPKRGSQKSSPVQS